MTKIQRGQMVVSVSTRPIVGTVVQVGNYRRHRQSAMVDVIDLAGKYKSILYDTVRPYKSGINWEPPKPVISIKKKRFVRRKREQTA